MIENLELTRGIGMTSAAKNLQLKDIQALRKDAGRWLRTLRERRGLSQRQVAEGVGISYYTFVSQLETGRGRITSDQYLKWAEVLGVEPRDFVKTLMRFYDPVTFELLFPADMLHSGISRSEPSLRVV